jgi:hypothetical protein
MRLDYDGLTGNYPMALIRTTGMANTQATKRLLRAAWAGALGVLLVAAGAGLAAHAEDDEDEEPSFEKKEMNEIMGGLGAKTGPDIQYRERSPLVVPPKLDLPPPEDSAAITKNPAWPVDADVKRRKQAKSKEQSSGPSSLEMEAAARPLPPDQLNRGPRTGPNTQAPADDSGRRLTQSELGSKGIFSNGNLFGFGYSEEVGTFTQEPPRSSLVDPPPGYRTPSPSQPYGVSTKAQEPKAANPFDRGTEMR